MANQQHGIIERLLLPPTKETRVQMRWLCRRDMPEVCANDCAACEQAWVESDFSRALRERNTIGIIALHGEMVVGHMVYVLHEHHLGLERLVVAPMWQRRGVGAQMIENLKGKVFGRRRSRLVFTVREDNLAGLAFLKRHGFRCNGVLREHFGDRDGYQMEFWVDDFQFEFADD